MWGDVLVIAVLVAVILAAVLFPMRLSGLHSDYERQAELKRKLEDYLMVNVDLGNTGETVQGIDWSSDIDESGMYVGSKMPSEVIPLVTIPMSLEQARDLMRNRASISTFLSKCDELYVALGNYEYLRWVDAEVKESDLMADIYKKVVIKLEELKNEKT